MRWTRVFAIWGIVSAIVAISGRVAAQTTTETQIWTAAVLNARLTGESATSPGLSGWFDLHGRLAPDRFVTIVRPGLGYRLSGLLSVWGGYAWIPSILDSGPTLHEHRIWQQGLVQGKEGMLRYQIRPRLEQRFRQDQGEVGLRARLFGRANLRFVEKVPIDLALWDELFVGFNETRWGQPLGFDQNRAFAGIAWTIGIARIEGGYLNVVVERPNGSWVVQHNPSLWLFVSF